MKNSFLFVFFLLIHFPLQANGERFFLNDQNAFEGTILHYSDSLYVVQIGDTVRTISTSDVNYILMNRVDCRTSQRSLGASSQDLAFGSTGAILGGLVSFEVDRGDGDQIRIGIIAGFVIGIVIGKIIPDNEPALNRESKTHEAQND